MRRFVAVLLALLVVLETGGLARALAADGDIACCCGEHSVVRTCHCHDCPVAKRGMHERAGDLIGVERCGGGSGDIAVLAVLVHALPLAPTLVAPSVVSSSLAPPVRLRAGRLLEAGRPPP